jgi:hypothetical protein
MTADILDDMLPDIVVKATTESVTSSTTLQNDDELFLSVVASATYIMEGFIIHSSPTAGDIQIGFTGPSGATLSWGGVGAATVSTSSAAATEMELRARSISQPLQLGGQASAGTTALIGGTLITSSTAGTLQLQFAQFVSDASASQVRVGSWLKLQRIA